MMRESDSRPRPSSPITFNTLHAASIFVVSAIILALQIALMRSLAVQWYHHFSYVVISTALLGFGVSGTFLFFIFDRFKDYYIIGSYVLLVVFAVASPLCYLISIQLPVDIQFIFYDWHQLGWLLIYKFLLFCPFFFGAIFIGGAILYFREHVAKVYSANLLGSGAGGVLAVALMNHVAAIRLPLVVSAMSLLGLFLWMAANWSWPIRSRATVYSTGLAAIITAGSLVCNPTGHVDQHKAIAHLNRLERQADARLLLSQPDPRGEITIYDSDKVHHTLFAGLEATMLPPGQLSVLVDGHHAGAMFQDVTVDDVQILDYTPQSLAYRLAQSPKVLLLGEIDGANVWLSRRFGAGSITVVQGNRRLSEILRGDLADRGGNVFNAADVSVINQEPHLFIQQTQETFDIIHIVVGEGMAAGVSGLASLHEDYLLTTESIRVCIERLSDRGFITLTRGIQYPPRDNLKISGLFLEALKLAGYDNREAHFAQVRNYLAVTTLIAKSRLSKSQTMRIDSICEQLLMDAEYHPHIHSDRTNSINIINGPPGKKYSYFHHAALQLLSPQAPEFVDDWIYDIRPPSNDRPYFYNFFKWRSIPQFLESFGTTIFRKLEHGYLVLFFSCVETVVTALIMIVLPLFWLKRRRRLQSGMLRTAAYFVSLGFGFMFVEMICIQKFIRYLGDPIYSVTVVVTALLISAGLGSLIQERIAAALATKIRLVVAAILLMALLHLFAFDTLMSVSMQANLGGRVIFTVASLLPLGFFMGWMFPIGVEKLTSTNEEMLPWAWGLNGFASVTAAPLAVMLAMEFGFTAVTIAAVVLYLVAGLSFAGERKKLN